MRGTASLSGRQVVGVDDVGKASSGMMTFSLRGQPNQREDPVHVEAWGLGAKMDQGWGS